MDMVEFAEALKHKAGVDGEKSWKLVENWYTCEGRARRVSLHDLYALTISIVDILGVTRIESAMLARNAIFDYGIGDKTQHYTPIIRKDLAAQLVERAIIGKE